MISNIAILTSGGDSQGMNSAVRAIGKGAIHNGLNAFVVYNGYQGLVDDNFKKMELKDFSNITDKGGTFIYTARFPDFQEDSHLSQAIVNLNKHKIDTLFIIGGNGSYLGAELLVDKGLNVITLPGTIDRDVFSSHYSIGFDTCLNRLVDIVDNIRDTALSHGRVHIIETMGRHCGDLTLMTALATGADVVSTTEKPLTYDEIKSQLQKGIKNNKRYQFVIVTEFLYDIEKMALDLEKDLKRRVKPTVVGAPQRGGKPSAYDRVAASKMGYYALRQAIAGNFNIAITYNGANSGHLDLKEANKASKNQSDVDIAHQIIKNTL